MKKRIYENDIIELANGRLEKYSITKEDYYTIKDMIHLCIQNNEVLSDNEPDFFKSFVCIEFSEGYIVMYHYNP